MARHETNEPNREIMNALDLILILILLWGGIAGYRNGFFREAASLLGLIMGIFLAIIAADIAGRVLTGMVSWNPLPVRIIVFLLTFVLIAMLLRALGDALTRVFKVILLNFFNRLVGFVFGLAKVALLLSLVLFLIRLLDQQWSIIPDSWIQGSLLYARMEGLAPSLFGGLTYL
jgi:membrane protein required for colicin V production